MQPVLAAVARRARAARPSAGQGSGLWPHSPAMALGPVQTRPSRTTPPPTPVPRMTPKTTRAPAAAPSTGLRQREAVGVVREAQRARADAGPGPRPAAGRSARRSSRSSPGPWRARSRPACPRPPWPAPPARAPGRATRRGDGVERGGVVVARRGDAAAGRDRAVVGEGDGLDLGPAQVDADAAWDGRGGATSAPPRPRSRSRGGCPAARGSSPGPPRTASPGSARVSGLTCCSEGWVA